jgi:hypothetical protein
MVTGKDVSTSHCVCVVAQAGFVFILFAGLRLPVSFSGCFGVWKGGGIGFDHHNVPFFLECVAKVRKKYIFSRTFFSPFACTLLQATLACKLDRNSPRSSLLFEKNKKSLLK